MFYYRKQGKEYFVSSDKSIWEYGPFLWIYIKNTPFWDIDTDILDLNTYPNYKYIYWVWKDHIFIVWWAGIILLKPLKKCLNALAVDGQ